MKKILLITLLAITLASTAWAEITKEIVVDQIEIVGEYNQIQVRTATVIKEDGVELSRSFHRHVVAPDSDITNETDKVKAVAGAVHTKEVKARWTEKKLKDH